MNRFEFGKNWSAYVAQLTETQLTKAQKSLSDFLGHTTLRGKTFLDIGSGSGIHSYAALLMGAQEVISFDRDIHSVEAATQLKKIKAPNDPRWKIQTGDILDDHFSTALQRADIVYSWGVLHHTGNMKKAIENTVQCVAPGGVFFVALYNKHWTSPIWTWIKRVYCASPRFLQNIYLGFYIAADVVRQAIFKGRNPRTYIRQYSEMRGMEYVTDMRDWLGGYPYEYISADELRLLMVSLGFTQLKAQLTSSIGCSEFLFQRTR